MANRLEIEDFLSDDRYEYSPDTDTEADKLFRQIAVEGGIENYILQLRKIKGAYILDNSESAITKTESLAETTSDTSVNDGASSLSVDIQKGTEKIVTKPSTSPRADGDSVMREDPINKTHARDTANHLSVQSAVSKNSQRLIVQNPGVSTDNRFDLSKKVWIERLLTTKKEILMGTSALVLALVVGLSLKSTGDENLFPVDAPNIDSSPKVEYAIDSAILGTVIVNPELPNLPPFLLSPEPELTAEKVDDSTVRNDIGAFELASQQEESTDINRESSPDTDQILAIESNESDALEALDLSRQAAASETETTSQATTPPEAAADSGQEAIVTTNESIVKQQIAETANPDDASSSAAPAVQPVASSSQHSLTNQQIRWVQAAGIAEADWEYVDYIMTKESNWGISVKNPKSSAYGLCQRMLSVWPVEEGDNYMTDPVDQLEWCDWYANFRYGGWESSYHAWQSKHWW